MNRIDKIRAALTLALQPLTLEIEDESHLHVGHAGAASGRGHFNLRLVSQAFSGQSVVARHRLVYEALGGLMQSEIHALSIRALTPDEAQRQTQG